LEREAASDPGSAAGWPNLVTMFFDQADRFGERPLLWAKRDQHYRALGWRDVAARVCGLARGLRALGIEHGDRVLVVAENRPEWLISDLAIMATGGVTVPAYTTNTQADQRYLLEDSGAKGAIVSTARLARTLLAAMEPGADTPPPFVVMMETPGADARLEPPAGVQVLTWDDVIARGERDHSNVLCNADQVAPTDLACIIYTSGTGGTPKGVMLQHEAILHNCAGAIEVVRDIGPGNDTFLSFLPLSHAFEHTVGQFVPLALGAEIFYAEGIDRVGANMLEARPTIIAAVPRFYELLRQRILHGVQKQSALRRRLFDRTIAFGTRRAEDPHALGFAERLVDWGLDHSVRRTVRQRFGGRIRAMVSGGAPLSEEVGAFFVALGLPLFQGYGQTEAAPLISVNRPGQAKLGTVGPPLPGVEIRIAEDGEILARGKMVMKGYWRNAEATREAIRDGWLHTGDIGRIDEDGHIRITDRKKDIIVNSGGDNLSPARVEAALTLRPEIAQAMVYGDRKPHLVALLVPDAAWARSWAASASKAADIAALADDGDFHRAIGAIVDEVNKTLSVIERVRRFIIVAKAFSLDNGQLTPTLKLRRHVILEQYRPRLDALYAPPCAPSPPHRR
jgi:long-chain acyl-CoA synthetase